MKKAPFTATGCAVKIIVGSVFVGALIIGAVYLTTSIIPPKWQHPGLIAALVLPVFVLGVELATAVLSPKSTTPFGILGLKRKDFTVEAVRAKGELLQQTFHATRAFQVTEREDEGCQYFIELTDGSVLFLQGQYLYDFEPITDDPDENQPRRFPCTEFVVSRDVEGRYFIQLDCHGTALEPECLAPPFSRRDYREDRVPDDGDIISDISYDELKRQRMAATG
ncbi:hypothetical protein [Prosthecobacter sp.]|uniref:hypothetical protein n=1 Tax=Prosthecobacter sp. TaxID=1965333 RepID=UPI003783ACDE